MALQAKLLELHNSVLEAEGGQRGYLLTRQPEYLDPFKRAIDGEHATAA